MNTRDAVRRSFAKSLGVRKVSNDHADDQSMVAG
jgi:hypothetical protein